MSEVWHLGALELAARINICETTSRAVAEAHLVRIDAVNPHLSAVVPCGTAAGLPVGVATPIDPRLV